MTGREEQINNLNTYFESDNNNITVLYGRYRVGKTALIREFSKEKNVVYFECAPTVDFELLNSINRAFSNQIEGYVYASNFDGVFEQVKNSPEIKLLVFEEFQNIVKADLGFLVSLLRFMQELGSSRKIMVLFTSSSVSWVENSMVKTIGRAALSINAFVKLKELSYVDIVGMFPECNVNTLLCVYALTGGVPGYVSMWNPKATVKENICKLFLDRNGVFAREAELFIKDEFRETGVYSTILKCLAGGMNKLNEIHEYTGYGRDKISVYLKNMIEREIVEKVFSYDSGTNEHTRKGLYRIQDDFINFWYRFVYPDYAILASMEPEDFYDKYVEPGLNEFLLEAFIKIAGEFMDIVNDMGRFSATYDRKGRWHGKTGDLHVIYQNDNRYIIGQAYVGDKPVDITDYQAIIDNAMIAGIKDPVVYMFSACGFTQGLEQMAGDKLVTVAIEDL